MSDLYKPAGQHMQKEPADELDRVQCHLFNLIVVLRVSPTEADPSILQAEQSSVGNGYSVGVSCQIPQDLLWATKRGLGVNHPFPVTERGRELRKTDWVGEFSKLSIELQVVRSKRLFQISEELTTKIDGRAASPARRTFSCGVRSTCPRPEVIPRRAQHDGHAGGVRVVGARSAGRRRSRS